MKPTDSTDRPVQIEVTQEMIEAGRQIYLDLASRKSFEVGELVERILRMGAAQTAALSPAQSSVASLQADSSQL